MDFIDSAIYLKEKGLAPKLGVLGLGESGSVTTLASTFCEPLLFDCAVAHVRNINLFNRILSLILFHIFFMILSSAIRSKLHKISKLHIIQN